jgi:hypothetical protein
MFKIVIPACEFHWVHTGLDCAILYGLVHLRTDILFVSSFLSFPFFPFLSQFLLGFITLLFRTESLFQTNSFASFGFPYHY